MTNDDFSGDEPDRSVDGAPPPPPPPPDPGWEAFGPAPSAYPRSDTRGLGMLVQLLVGLVMIATLFTIWAIWQEIQIIEDIDANRFVSFEDADASDDRVALAAILSLVSYAATGLAYFFWVHRSYQTLHWLRAEAGEVPPDFSPGGAVGWHFVPFVNFVRIPRIIGGLFRWGRPPGPTPPIIGWWWGLFIGANLLAMFPRSEDSSLNQLRVGDYLEIVSDGLWLVSAALLILIVRSVTNTQNPDISPAGSPGPQLLR